MLSIQTHTCTHTHMDIHPSLPPAFFLTFFFLGLSFSFPCPSQELSIHFLPHLSFSPARLALLFLFLFLYFLRLFSCLLMRFLRQSAAKRLSVCVTLCFQEFLHAGGSRACSWREPTKLQVQTRISKEGALSTYLLSFSQAVTPFFRGLLPWWFA